VADLLLGFYTTSLDEAEIITAVTLPPRDPSRDRDVYLKYVSRSSEDRPCVGVAANVRFTNDAPTVVESLRIAIGAAAGTPQRLPEVDALATGQPLTADLAEQIANEYAEQITPMDDLRGSAWYRRQMIRHFTREALKTVATAETGRTAR
jgi:carbon-monoxide dehydrogenase medium subunit